MDQFMDDDSGDEIEIGSDPEEFPTDNLYAFVDPISVYPMHISSDESNPASLLNDNTTASTSSEPATYNFTPEQLKLINDFNTDFSKKLQEKAGTGDLLSLLYHHWSVYVPLCFNVTDNPLKNLIETEVHRLLLQPLEQFVCNSEDNEKVLAELTELEDPPQLCGKVFKAGEPSYFCRDCGSDPTCVLCSNCFRRSKHREHRYKMMTSGGGGYCDCGDPEAWKQHPNCELHMPKEDTKAKESVDEFVSKLPEDLSSRASQLFAFLLDYIFDMLSVEKEKDQLPDHLKPEPFSDDYVTMLYNDEVHSYEDVTGTLRKVLGCDDKKALEYAAVVDKEGRSAIKRGKQVDCQKVREKVELKMGTSLFKEPLETKVLHHSLVSHQYFAEKLLVWLQKICESSNGLKHILCKLGVFVREPEPGHCLVEKLMLSDTMLWKSARSIVHQYYISVYFMDPNWKREFAVLYTRNYKSIWRNYVKNPDDTVSLTDLAVQMFTVISLAKHLMENYSLMQIIMDTLIEHSKTSKGKLNFSRSRNKSNPEFKRAQFILYDLKYCLTAVPDEWTDPLRNNFVLGFKSFIDFMKFMHGMDSLTRQTHTHVEYEPEWETSFNLLIKMARPVSSLIEWCTSDRGVYIECLKYLLHTIYQVEVNDPQFKYIYDKKKFGQTYYEVIDTKVIKQEVSIHAPLTRLFAALYMHIDKYQLDFHSFYAVAKLHLSASSPLAFAALKHDLAEHKMSALLEPSLRSLVLVAQTNAGLWKRNGFSLLSQVYFYSNIKCRHDMFDRDVACLQMAASVMEPNEFLANLLTHYNLFEFYTDENFDAATAPNFPEELKQNEYLLPISEDLLELLIHVVSEVYECEVSEIDALKKVEREVVQQLCIAPMAHSDIVKNVYTDTEKLASEQEINSVLARVAVFKPPRPNSNEKGVYTLREQFHAQYSPYFYHYVKAEKTKSEEAQLGLKTRDSDKFFRPSPLPRLRPTFAAIEHLLDADLFIKICVTVIRRSLDKTCRYFSDGQLAKVLHLIGLALHKEKNDIDDNAKNTIKLYTFKFLEKTVQQSSKPNLLELLAECSSQLVTNQYKLLSMWILDYTQTLRDKKFVSEPCLSGAAASPDETASTSSRRSNSPTEDGGVQKEKRKNLVAEKRRAKILAQLNKQQKNFIQNNKTFFDETKGLTVTSGGLETASTITMETELSSQNQVVCIGPNQTVTKLDEIQKKSYQCILCQEEEEISLFRKPKPMVLCCYVQHSKVLSKARLEPVNKSLFHSNQQLFMPNSLNSGVITNSCGHVMCATCWQKYVDTYRLSENRRHMRYLSYNVKEEFTCPLCETVGNTVLPIYPDFRELNTKNSSALAPAPASTSSAAVAALSYEDWLDGLEKTLEQSVKRNLQDGSSSSSSLIVNPCRLSTITKLMADAVAYNFKSLFEFDSFTHLASSLPSSSKSTTNSESESKPSGAHIQQQMQEQLTAETKSVMQAFNKTTVSMLSQVKCVDNNASEAKPLAIMLNCAYTIQCIEQCLSSEAKCLFGDFSVKQSTLLSNIVKQAALSSLYTGEQPLVRESCVRLLAAILPYQTAKIADSLFDSPSIVDVDLFHFLVYLTLSLPNLYEHASPPTTSTAPSIANIANLQVNYFNIFKLCLQAHCVQIVLIKLKNKKLIESLEGLEPPFDENETKVYEFYQHLLTWFANKRPVEMTDTDLQRLRSNPRAVNEMIRVALMPFLRNAALFFAHLTDLTPLVKITSNDYDLDENFAHLLGLLGLSSANLSDVLDLEKNSLRTLCDFWLSTVTVSLASVAIDYPLEVNRLIELPNDYIDLISMSMSSNVCQSRSSSSSLMDTSSESSLPTYICLICGEKLCGQTFCCLKEIGTKRVGSCTAHAYKCGNNVGMFLRVAECQVLLLHLDTVNDNLTVRGCFLPAPYVDDYGETDQYLKRGNPLKLCPSRYQKLYKDWLSHSVPDVISRRYQADSGIYQHTDWIQL